MPSYKTLYTKSQARVEKLTDLVINSNEKTVVLIDEIGHLRIELAEREGKISALSTELAVLTSPNSGDSLLENKSSVFPLATSSSYRRTFLLR